MDLILKDSKVSRIIAGLYLALQLKKYPLFKIVILKEDIFDFDLSYVLGRFGHQF